MSNRTLVKAAKDILRYVVINNRNTVPITLIESAQVIDEYQRENDLEDLYNDIQMQEAKSYNTERMRTEMGDVL
jgi:hypothetical protein